MYAYCWANGVIRFGKKVPETAIPFAKLKLGKVRDFRESITACARLAYDNCTWLVPGIPESENQDQAIEALIKWCDWLKLRKWKGIQIL